MEPRIYFVGFMNMSKSDVSFYLGLDETKRNVRRVVELIFHWIARLVSRTVTLCHVVTSPLDLKICDRTNKSGHF